jgi:hypothetical protein
MGMTAPPRAMLCGRSWGGIGSSSGHDDEGFGSLVTDLVLGSTGDVA